MHVLNALFIPGCAGTERAFIDYTHALLARRHRLTLLVHPAAPFLPELEIPGVTVIRSAVTGPPDHDFGLFDCVYFRDLVGQIRPDVVLSHGHLDTLQLKRAVRGRLPFVAVNHDPEVRYSVGSDAAIALTRSMFARVVALGQPSHRTFHVPNMVAAPSGPAPTVRPYRDPPVIGVLSRLEREKGVDRLIEAVALLVRDGRELQVLIGGDGTLEEALAAQARRLGIDRRVTFLGWVHDRDRFYESIDVFCLPSRAETFGIVLLEAAVRGVPIVCTDGDGARELFAEEPIGVMVPRDDPDALAEGLRAALDDARTAARRAAAAFTLASTRYSRGAVAARIDEALHAAVALFELEARIQSSRAPVVAREVALAE